MGGLSCSTPFLLFPPLLLLLLCFSTFHKQQQQLISPTTLTSSYSFPLFQANATANLSATSTQGNDFFDAFFWFNSSNSNIRTTNTTTEVLNTTGGPRIREKSSLEKIENGLARARAAIREAVRTRNYTSHKEEDFIPRGSIYRNPYAFHQSYIEMEKRFRVWVYKEGEPPLVHDGPVNNIYSTEGQFMDEMESGKNPLMAMNPDEAHAFYLPFSVHNVLRYVINPEKKLNRGLLQLVVEDYVRVIASKYAYWNRSRGADHFMASCHDWWIYFLSLGLSLEFEKMAESSSIKFAKVHGFDIIKFNGKNNFTSWKTDVREILMTLKQIKALKGKPKKSATRWDDEKWSDFDTEAYSTIRLCLKRDITHKFSGEISAKVL